VLFVVPFALAVTLTFKRRSSALLLIISSLLFAIAISPWEYRNWRLSGTSIVHGSSVYPKIDGYHAWVKSWAVTEYERAYAIFPVWERRLDDISIKPNYFLSEREARQAYDLILKAKIDNNLWTEAIDNQFKHLAGLRYSRTSFFDWLLLRTWQSLSLLAHPANSWGFPINLSSNNFYTKVSEYSIDSQVFRDLEKIILKGALFCYRVILLGIFFIGCLLFLKKFIVNFREIAKANFKPTRRTLETANSVDDMYLLAMSMFFASIFFFVFFFYAHEHRFLTIVMPWIEVAACLFVAQKMTFSEK
jgi:hypothetical protein